MTKVKICGITNLEDAKLALKYGADALGFNFSEASPRRISPAAAQTIVRQLPPNAWFVGVFVNQTKDEVKRIAHQVGLDSLQFHGDETESYLKDWGSWRVIKALRIGSAEDVEKAAVYLTIVDHILVDSRVEGSYGGTGVGVQEELLEQLLAKDILKNSFLAGGLTPDNVKHKIKHFQPFGVDVASGVEETVGKKSSDLLQAFIAAAR